MAQLIRREGNLYMNRAFSILLMLGVVVSLVLVACANETATPTKALTATSAPSGTPTPTPKPTVLTIGASATLTGGGAVWGISLVNAVAMAIDEVNAAGGLVLGGKRYTFNYISADNKYTIEGDLENVKKFINTNGVKHIVMGGNSWVAQDYGETQKALTMIHSYAAPSVGKDKTYSFRSAQTGEQSGAPLWQYIKDTYPGLTRVAQTAPNYGVGDDMMLIGQAAVDWLGGYTITYNKLYDAATTDFAPLVTAIMATKPDIIDLGGTPPENMAPIIKLARDTGFKGPIVTVSAGVAWDVLQSLTSAAALEGFIAPAPDYSDPNLPKEASQFQQRYLQRWGSWIVTGAINYDTTRTLFAGFKAADSVDPTAIRDAMQKAGFEVPWLLGPARFGGEDLYGINNQAYAPQYIVRFEGGKPVIKKSFSPDETLALQRKTWAKFQALRK